MPSFFVIVPAAPSAYQAFLKLIVLSFKSYFLPLY